MASCTVTYSSEIAQRAGRTFFWRKWRTKFGLLLLSSFAVITASLAGWIALIGPNWVAGMLGTILAFNLLLQAMSFFATPRALARSVADPARKTAVIDTGDAGVKISQAGNVTFLPWTQFSYIWVYDDFVLLPLDKVVFSRFLLIPADGMTAEVRADIESASRAVSMSSASRP